MFWVVLAAAGENPRDVLKVSAAYFGGARGWAEEVFFRLTGASEKEGRGMSWESRSGKESSSKAVSATSN